MQEARPATHEERYVYMLVVLFHDGNPKKSARYRTWGWFSSLDEAKVVFEGHVEMHMEAGYYNYAVIEKVPEGSHRFGKAVAWYHAEGLGYGEYRLTALDSPPEFAQGVGNFWG